MSETRWFFLRRPAPSHPAPSHPAKALSAHLLFGLPILTAVGACDSSPQKIWTGQVRDSSGVVIVENTLRGIWSEGGGWTLEEEMRLGGLAGDIEYQFGQVGTLAVDSAGSIYVPDIQAQEIRVFSPGGGFLRTIGRPGHGPGELALGASVALLSPGDTLLIPDRRNRRINRFSPEGEVLESAPLAPEEGTQLRYNLTPNRVMTAQVRPLARPNQPAPDTMDAIVEIQTSGLLGDTLLRIPTGGLFQGPGIHYFTPEPWWDVTDSLTAVYGMNDEFRIRFYDRERRLRRIVSMPLEPAPITHRDIRAFFAYLDRAWLDAGVPPSRLAANHERVTFNETLPIFSLFHLGSEGSLWVQPVLSPGSLSDEEIEQYNFIEEFGGSDWWVFDSEGRYLGIVAMPERFTPRLFLDDLIYGVARDELDVQYVVRLRIARN